MFIESNGRVQRQVGVKEGHVSVKHTQLASRSKKGAFSPHPSLIGVYDVLCDAFLPEGFPQSVTDDYLEYQAWDTFQALCSSVTGTLSTRAVLQGFGVGQAEATLLSGTLSWVLRDCTGMIARLVLAAHMASDLDNDNKRWRLVADVTNDLAMMIEIFSACLPEGLFMMCVCIASILRAVCGVSGGSSRASLTQHFATRRNTADVSAKDGSQETAASFIGMWFGMLVAYLVPATSLLGTSVIFLFFTAAHLYCNYKAVCSVCLRHFNQVRAHLCMSQFVTQGTIPLCSWVNRRDVLLRCPLSVTFGAQLSDALPHLGKDQLSLFDSSAHHFAVVSTGNSFVIVLRDGCTPDQMLLAYFMCVSNKTGVKGLVRLTPSVLKHFEDFTKAAEEGGYNCANPQFRVRDWRVMPISAQLPLH